MTGVTGVMFNRAIVAGERDPDKLAALRDVRCKENPETIHSALVGNHQPEHLLRLKQTLALYNFYQRCIEECDTEIERAVATLNIDRPTPEAPLPKAKHGSRLPSDPGFDMRSALYQLTGTDLTKSTASGRSLPCA